MRNLIITAAAVAAVATLSSAPVSAEPENWGPSKVGNMCYKQAADSGRELRFGAWGACPKTASAPRRR
jgi:hypothetical protein